MAIAALLVVGSLACAAPEPDSSAVSERGSTAAAAPRADSDLPGTGADAGRTVIYRDSWGVPHIYAPTIAAGLYAEGWAQAEDRPDQLLRDLMMGLGEFASVVGEPGLEVDLRTRMWDHYGVAKSHWGELRSEVREHLEAFARGINDCYAAHPGDVPEWWRGRQVDPYMVLAFTRLFTYNWSIDEVYGDLRRGGITPSFSPSQRGSNQFAIAPSRSAEKAAILAIDPHLSWDGPSRFWEFRIHAGEFQGSGTILAGAPYMGNGHSRTLAWAMTTGGPDTADVYELTLDPADPNRYRYDGEWRQLTTREVTIAVRDQPSIAQPLEFSHHGPIIARANGKAYAAKVAYAEVVNLPEAIYELNVGGDGYQAAVRALATLALFPQNVMVADTSGHIYYQRTGRVPRRPDGYDWSKPVDGSTSATEWQGFHPASDHLQVLDPPQGWMQNCNIPPDAMMPGSPFQLGVAEDYLFGSREYGELSGWTNQRGARAVELLAADDSVTVEEAMAYINDLEPYGADRWIEALRAADGAVGTEQAAQPGYRAGLDALAKWDGRLAADSHGALVYDYWRHQIFEEYSQEPEQAARALGRHRRLVRRGERQGPGAAGAVRRGSALPGRHHGARDGAAGGRARRRSGVRRPPSGGTWGPVLAARRRRRQSAPRHDDAAQHRLRRPAGGQYAVGCPRPDLDADRGVERSTQELDLPAMGSERPSRVASLFRSGREAVLQGRAQAELVAAGGAGPAHRVAHGARKSALKIHLAV